MNKTKLRSDINERLIVRTPDVKRLERIAHYLRQEISDPQLPNYSRTRYAEMIQAVDVLIDGAEELQKTEKTEEE